ncbi:protein mono-ADP-ribosyltransferase PARP12-like [Schistocerca nitens]|uniref:protein mono-ADP-ribosyltransferase PARP12-like n=1 Tax=Schistocerca nitens TaxID=7011 RepID=UPI002118062D|nr:protein mono-ADP-ribosyltransferase PARP12-like [Schistocerca nitens]
MGAVLSWFTSDSSNGEPIRPYQPQTYFEAKKRYEPSVPSNYNVRVLPSSSQEYNSFSYYASTLPNHSTLSNLQYVGSGHNQRYSLVKTADSTLHKSVLQLTVEWDPMDANSEFQLYLLPFGTWEYEEIFRLFKRTTQRQFMVHKIYRVQNPYLLGCYLLKKEEMKSRYRYVTEKYLFHGTKEVNKDSICKNNFDWRKHGHSVGNIFGKGVSFTPISCYASHYSDNGNTQRMMFVSKVLIAKEIVGNKDMVLPPVFDYGRCLRYDTATKHNGQVIVKFSDCEFYPSYIVYYTGQYVRRDKGNGFWPL